MSSFRSRPSRRAKTNMMNMVEDAMVLDEECMVCGNDTPQEQATKCAGEDCAAIVCGSCRSSSPFNCRKSSCKPKRNSMKKSASMQEEEFAIDSSSDESAEEGFEFDKATGWDDRKQPPTMAADSPSTSEIPWGDRKQPPTMAAFSPSTSEIPWGDRKQSPTRLDADSPSTSEMIFSSTTKQIKSIASSNPARVSLSPPSSAAQPKRQKQSDNNDHIIVQPNRPRPANAASPLPKIYVAHGGR
eukprot:scaffold5924_cov86-Skeletonema_menzelii.AAC.1